MLQIFGNFLLVWWCNSICEHVANDALPGCDWRHCADCGINVPPRSHHCPLCRHCIAVRDHHCFFTASCVGRNNQRHFIAFCVDCAIGTAYAVHVAYLYVTTFHGDGSYMYFIFPIACVRWIFGLQSGSSLLFVGFTYICAASFIGAAAVVVWQMFLVVRGQTSHEFMTGRWWNTRSFSPKAVTRNVRCVFGPYWPVVFLCPWPVFPMQGDSGYMKSIWTSAWIFKIIHVRMWTWIFDIMHFCHVVIWVCCNVNVASHCDQTIPCHLLEIMLII